MAPLKVELMSKDPVLFGQDNRFMCLGKLRSRGDVFVVFMDLTTGKTYVEEGFATYVSGQSITGLDEVKDDHLWGLLTEAAQKYGLCMVKHMGDCMKKAGVKVSPPVARALCMLPTDLNYFKQLGVIGTK